MNNNQSNRKTLKNKKTELSLRKIYGEMILKEGTVLYHTSSLPFEPNKSKPMLFLTFHPSDYITNINDDYVTQIKLEKDISLLFMIDLIKGLKIFSSLGKLIGSKNFINAKRIDKNLECYIKYLQKDNFNGWFTSVEDKTATEIAIINNPDLYKILSSNTNKNNWAYSGNNINGVYKPMNWGESYKISKNLVKLNIPIKFKDMIEEYKQTTNINSTTFLNILNNTKITFVSKNKNLNISRNNTHKNLWECP